MRDSYVFYRSFYEGAQDLEDSDRLKLYDAICEYALNDAETLSERSAARAVFRSVRVQIDVNNKRYENGKKGGRPKNQNKTKPKPKQNQNKTKPKPNVNVNDNDNANELDKALANFKEHRKQLKAPMTDQAEKLMMNKLEKLSGGSDQKKIAILNQSIENGWKGVFELKEKRSGFNNAPARDYDMKELELKLLSTN